MYLFKLVFLFILDIYPGKELMDHMVVLFLDVLGNTILFFIVAAPIYIPNSGAQAFPFLHIPEIPGIVFKIGSKNSHSYQFITKILWCLPLKTLAPLAHLITSW